MLFRSQLTYLLHKPFAGAHFVFKLVQKLKCQSNKMCHEYKINVLSPDSRHVCIALHDSELVLCICIPLPPYRVHNRKSQFIQYLNYLIKSSTSLQFMAALHRIAWRREIVYIRS